MIWEFGYVTFLCDKNTFFFTSWGHFDILDKKCCFDFCFWIITQQTRRLCKAWEGFKNSLGISPAFHVFIRLGNASICFDCIES